MKNIELAIKNNNLITKGDKIGVACSGGRDSMCLLHYLSTHKDDLGIEIVAINIDHNIRENSKRDTMFVMRYCNQHNIKFMSYSLNVLQYCMEKKTSIEEGAREARYEVFRSLISKGVVDKIALAHHMQDQSETILLNILRGTGLNGASGMDYVNGKFIRPLLSTTRAEIHAYIENNDIPYVDDETNASNDYSRNYIRNMIMPLIRSKWPNADNAICKFAEICRQDNKYIEDIAKQSDFEAKDGIVKIQTRYFIDQPSVINRVIRKALKAINVSKDIEKKHIELIKELALDGNNGSKINLPHNLVAIKEYNYITITNKTFKPARKEWKMEKGKIDIQEYGIINLSITRKFDLGEHNHIIDYNKVPKDAIIRFREAGDVFEKFGGGKKSLSDYLIDKKIPTRLRNITPVLASGNEILAVFGVEISNKVKIDKDTKTAWAVDIFKY